MTVDEAYDYLMETSKIFQLLSMDEQGELSMKLAKEMTEKEKKEK